MKAFDCVNKQEVEVTKEGLIDFMKKDRQIDMKFAEKRTDDMGYLTWDAENWTCAVSYTHLTLPTICSV